jgi:protein-disulfide isomerase
MTQGNRKNTRGEQDRGTESRAQRRAERREARRGTPIMQQSSRRSSEESSASGARTAQRRRERERSARRTRLLVIGGVIVSIVAILGLGVLLANQPLEASIPPVSEARYRDILASRSAEGYPRLGTTDAPVQVSVYSAFDCAECRAFHEAIIDRLVERVRSGSMLLTFVPLSGTGDVVNGEGAARAAVCVAEQGRFWAFHDALFAWQAQYGNQAFSNARLVSGVNALGVDRGQYDGCIGSGRPQEVLRTAREQLNALIDFPGIPGVTINGVVPQNEDDTPARTSDEVIAAIDRALASFAARQQPTATSPAVEATAESTPEATAAPEATDETREPDATPTRRATATPRPTATAIPDATDEAEATEPAA